MFRGAIVGLGNVALNGHLPAWNKNPDFRIVAGIDPAAEQRELFKKAMPEVKCFAALDECKDLGLDFVDISTPPHTHFALIEKALAMNCNVLCEKPLVLKEAELKALEAQAQKSSKILMTVHNWKFAPLCRKISELLQRQAVGKVRHCAWFVLRNGPAVTTDESNWRLDPQKSGGGILIDHGWHAFYLVLEWLARPPKNVLAVLENRQYESLPVEDTAKIQLEFEPANGSNLTAEIFLTWASRLRRNWGVIEGSEGTIQIEDNSVQILKNKAVAPDESYTFDPPLSQGSHHPDWFSFVIEEFSAELSGKKTAGGNFQISKSCFHLIQRAKESHEKASKVPFSPGS